MKEAVNFLIHIYSESTSDITSILSAEADGDKNTIEKYLLTVNYYVNGLIEKVNKERI